jgi:uncharacterized protein (TIGR00725 family)
MHPVPRRVRIAVVGPADATPDELATAAAVGTAIARQGAVLLCGGLGGVMAAAAAGASAADGLSVGFLPGYDPETADPAIALPLPTGLGEARNVVLVASADAVIAIGGGAGTLSEIGLALKLARPLVGLGTWRVEPPDGSGIPLTEARDAADAVRLALTAARSTGRPTRSDAP